jgi:hypothetical protein
MTKLTREEARDMVRKKVAYTISDGNARDLAYLLLQIQERTARECAEIAFRSEYCCEVGDIHKAFSLDAKEQEDCHTCENQGVVAPMGLPSNGPDPCPDCGPKEQEPKHAPVQECGGCRFWQDNNPPNCKGLPKCRLYPEHIHRVKDWWCGQWEAK